MEEVAVEGVAWRKTALEEVPWRKLLWRKLLWRELCGERPLWEVNGEYTITSEYDGMIIR